LEYTAEDANMMFEINVTGVFMTSQAVAKQMIRFGNGGSIALIASMSAHAANRVSSLLLPVEGAWEVEKELIEGPGPDLSGV